MTGLHLFIPCFVIIPLVLAVVLLFSRPKSPSSKTLLTWLFVFFSFLAGYMLLSWAYVVVFLQYEEGPFPRRLNWNRAIATMLAKNRTDLLFYALLGLLFQIAGVIAGGFSLFQLLFSLRKRSQSRGQVKSD
jgi:hypothetical protein